MKFKQTTVERMARALQTSKDALAFFSGAGFRGGVDDALKAIEDALIYYFAERMRHAASKK